MIRRRPSPVIALLLFCLAGVAACLAGCGGKEDPRRLSASGTVEATEIHIGFAMPGRLDSLHVQEGDRLEPGMKLALLDRAETLARREQLTAQIAAAHAALLELEHGFQPEEIAQAEAARDAARQQRDETVRDLKIARELFDGGAISRHMLDKAVTGSDIAASQLKQAEERLGLLEKGYRQERIAAGQAQLKQAEAALRVLDATLENMALIARSPGIVTIRHRVPNEIVAAGAPVLTVLDMQDRWIRIYIPEDRIGAVRLGQPAAIAIDTFPEKRYAGQVAYISTEAEFTPKTVQTAEERVRLVYAVKIRIADDPAGDLKPGMPADVTLQ